MVLMCLSELFMEMTRPTLHCKGNGIEYSKIYGDASTIQLLVTEKNDYIKALSTRRRVSLYTHVFCVV